MRGASIASEKGFPNGRIWEPDEMNKIEVVFLDQRKVLFVASLKTMLETDRLVLQKDFDCGRIGYSAHCAGGWWFISC